MTIDRLKVLAAEELELDGEWSADTARQRCMEYARLITDPETLLLSFPLTPGLAGAAFFWNHRDDVANDGDDLDDETIARDMTRRDMLAEIAEFITGNVDSAFENQTEMTGASEFDQYCDTAYAVLHRPDPTGAPS
jgi:hypothetical protein